MSWVAMAAVFNGLLALVLFVILVVAINAHRSLSEAEEKRYEKAFNEAGEWRGKAEERLRDNKSLNKQLVDEKAARVQDADAIDEGNKAIKILSLLNDKECAEGWQNRASFHKVVPIRQASVKRGQKKC